ncbi:MULTISPECIES: ester cyclase [Virgibacillus]|uniref:Predicted ester cyclase n=3 Tax=Virgibacillus TaxID=84406 RepID=A0A1H0XRN1_9BACI|nr:MULTISPECIES: ester cyclase [Virgibacillus]MBP1950800.1 putative ester cyclase [Virgibacillus litoralis]SDQ05503.1 Predicted ester cyclase [Virgibacillus salinus]
MNKKRLVERWFNEIFTKGDINALKEITAPNFVSHVPNHDFNGHDEFINDFMNWFRTVFTNDVWSIEDYLELEDKVAVRYTGHMTYKGGWEDIPSSDQRVKETGIMIIRFESGLIKEMWCEMSDLDVMNQLKK